MSEIPDQFAIDQAQRGSESDQGDLLKPRDSKLLGLPKGVEFGVTGGVLLPETEARASHGVPGDILAILHLPEMKDGVEKQVAIVDYGENWKDKPLSALKGIPRPGRLGRPQTRYGLKSFNFKPEESLVGYAPLHVGDTMLGRTEKEAANKLLGLRDHPDAGEPPLDEEQVTVRLSPDGQLSFIQHSDRGGALEVSPDVSGQQTDTEVTKALGAIALPNQT